MLAGERYEYRKDKNGGVILSNLKNFNGFKVDVHCFSEEEEITYSDEAIRDFFINEILSKRF